MQPMLMIQFEKYALPNGLQVILHEDHSLPFVHLHVCYHVGPSYDKPGRAGLGHLFEHMMFEGSKHANDHYFRFLERVGATDINGTTEFDRTNYFETVPREALAYALWLESDRMAYLLDAVTQERLDNQREVVKNEILQWIDRPYSRTFNILWTNLFPNGHPYSQVYGSMEYYREDLSAVTLEDIRQFQRTYYVPNNASLVIAGDFNPSEAKALVEKYFGPIPPGPFIEHLQHWVPTLDGEKRIAVTDRVTQERLYLAYPAPPLFVADEAELDIAGRVLGEGKNSRLYRRLVYDTSMASDVSVVKSSWEIAGGFVITVTAQSGQSLDTIERAVDEEVERLAQQGPTDEEVNWARAGWEQRFMADIERLSSSAINLHSGRANRLNLYNIWLGRPDYFHSDYERYQKVTPSGVRDAVRHYLFRRGRVVVRCVPEKSVRPQTQDVDRSPPALGKRTSFAPPMPRSTTLSNGLTVIVSERHAFPTAAVNLVVKAGAAADPSGKEGNAWMTAEMLDEGSRTRSALEIAQELERLGATLSTAADLEASTLALRILSRNLDTSTAILADVALQPDFPAEELERQRQRRLDAILRERENPQVLASQLFPRLLYGPDHTYGRWPGGAPDSLRVLTATDLVAFYEAHYRPENAALIFTGDVGFEEAVALAERHFGAWKRGVVSDNAILPTSAPDSPRVYLVHSPQAQQSQICVGSLGAPRKAEDYAAIQVMNAIFGGTFTSRLNLNLREKKGYTYGASSRFTHYTQSGYWVSRAPVQANATAESITEMLEEIRGLYREHPPTDSELESAKLPLVRQHAMRFETSTGVAEELSQLFIYGLPLDTPHGYEEQVMALTLDQVRAAAQRYLNPLRLIILVVGDLFQVEPLVGTLNLGPVTVIDADGRSIDRYR